MGLFGKKPAHTPEAPYAILPALSTINVVRSQFYQDALEAASGGAPGEMVHVDRWASLIRERHNRFDPNAIAVYVRHQRVGYVGRQDAERYAPLLDRLWRRRGLQAVCRACIVGRPLTDKDGVPIEGTVSYTATLALSLPRSLVRSHDLPTCDDNDLFQEPPPLPDLRPSPIAEDAGLP
jgi:hypothetical protein